MNTQRFKDFLREINAKQASEKRLREVSSMAMHDLVTKAISHPAGLPLTSFNHLITLPLAKAAYHMVNHDGAPGIDGLLHKDITQGALASLVARMRDGRYLPHPNRRTHIKKWDGSLRDLGIPCVIDRVGQRIDQVLLSAVYERLFYPCSFGFRESMNCHQALTSLSQVLTEMGGGFLVDADISKFFDKVPHDKLMEFIRLTVTDGVILQHLRRWLKAGVVIDGVLTPTELGTPQGGVISPLLANAFLHHVLDGYFIHELKSSIPVRAELFRYADDFVIVVQDEHHAHLIHELVGKRLNSHGLELHPDKTRIIDFRCPERVINSSHEVFHFLGYELKWLRNEHRDWEIHGRTAPNRSLRSIERWAQKAQRLLREHRRGGDFVLTDEYIEFLAYACAHGFGGYYKALGNEPAVAAHELEVQRIAEKLWASAQPGGPPLVIPSILPDIKWLPLCRLDRRSVEAHAQCPRAPP